MKNIMKSYRYTIGKCHRCWTVLQNYANEDLEQFRISVHGIKGSSRNIGAEDLADEALRLEELAKEGKQAEILAKLDEFLNTLDEVMTRVDTYLKDVHPNR